MKRLLACAMISMCLFGACSRPAPSISTRITREVSKTNGAFEATVEVSSTGPQPLQVDIFLRNPVNVNNGFSVNPPTVNVGINQTKSATVSGVLTDACAPGSLDLEAGGGLSTAQIAVKAPLLQDSTILDPVFESDQKTFSYNVAWTCCPGAEGTYSLSEGPDSANVTGVSISPSQVSCPAPKKVTVTATQVDRAKEGTVTLNATGPSGEVRSLSTKVQPH